MIETYLDGKLKGKDLKKFKEQIEKDPSLKKKIQLYKEINEAIVDDDIENFRNLVKSIKNTGQGRKIIFTVARYIAVASIVVLLGIWFANNTTSTEKLYGQLYNPYETDFNKRSVEKSTDKIEFAFLLYEEGDYEASFAVLENYLEQNNSNSTARFFYGLCAIELKKYDLAEYTLQTVANENSTPYSIHAKWYLALTYLKTDKIESANALFNELAGTKNVYQQKAKKALKKTRP